MTKNFAENNGGELNYIMMYSVNLIFCDGAFF